MVSFVPTKKGSNFVEIYRENNENTVQACNNSVSSGRKPKIGTKNLEVFLFYVMYRLYEKSRNRCSNSLIFFALFWSTLYVVQYSTVTKPINVRSMLWHRLGHSERFRNCPSCLVHLLLWGTRRPNLWVLRTDKFLVWREVSRQYKFAKINRHFALIQP